MKKNDLIELIQSILEEDAIINRLFHLFHLNKGYKISTLEEIISIGVKQGILLVLNTTDENTKYHHVDWSYNNNYQELIFANPEIYIPMVFSNDIRLPEIFLPFAEW